MFTFSKAEGEKLLDKEYKVDGLVPYPWMAKYASNITSKYN